MRKPDSTQEKQNTDTNRKMMKTEIRIENICFLIESAFGEIPMDEIMTDYVAERIKEHDTADHAA